jgi:hypothetical protein
VAGPKRRPTRADILGSGANALPQTLRQGWKYFLQINDSAVVHFLLLCNMRGG